jgi:hypothetical protein
MSNYQPATSTLPLGVAILAILIGIYGFLVFVLGLLVAVASSYAGSLGAANPAHALGVTGLVAGIIILIIGLIILGTAVGLWDLRMWALVLAILVLIVIVGLDALAGAFVSFGFIVGVILIIYLAAVSRHFS